MGAPTSAVGDAALENANARSHVRKIVQGSGTSFYWAMRFLPAEKRNAMFAVYAFCRVVDDIADEPGDPREKMRLLGAWRTEIEQLFAGAPQSLLACALQAPVARYGLQKRDFLTLIDGMEIDAREKLRIESMSELEIYVDRVACTVGRLSSRIFGAGNETGERIAQTLGSALQLTNILRDPLEDAELDRLYFPAVLLRKHGIETDEPYAVISHPAFARVCEELAAIAEKHFVEARALLACTDRRAMRPAIVMMEVYERLLKRLQRRGWERANEEVSLSKVQKLWIGLRYGLL